MTTSVGLSPVAILQFFDNTGKPCIGGTLLTQSGGVNYPTYSEPTGTTALPNPIPLNSRGEISTAVGTSTELFLQTGVAYTFTLKDAAGNQLWSVGNITAMNGQAVSFPTASGSANAQIVTNAVPISLGIGTIQWFLPVAANTAATTINVDNSGAKNAFFLTKALVGGELQVGVPAQIIYDGTQWNLVQSAKGPVADYYVDNGSVNALSIPNPNFAQLAINLCDGFRVKVKAANTTTAASPTLRINGTGFAGTAVIYYADGVTPLVSGAIIANNIYDFIFNTSIGTTPGGYICTNPSQVSGTFTATLATGLTTTPSGTLNYSISSDGKTATVWANSTISGTSNASGMTISGFPAILTAANDHTPTIAWRDNGARLIGAISAVNTTTWVCLAGSTLVSTGFTTSGSKGWQAGATVTYILN